MRRTRGDEGQSTVELALVLPLVCLLLLLVVQVGLIVHSQLVVGHAAREGARAAAVDPHPYAARAAVILGTPLDADRVVVETRASGSDHVEVEVRYTYEADLPLVGALVPDVDLSARATMFKEH